MAWVKATLQALAATTQSQLPEGGTPTKGRRTQHRLAVAKTMPRSKSRGAEWSFARTFQHACKKALATAAMNTAQVKVSTPSGSISNHTEGHWGGDAVVSPQSITAA